MADLVHEPLDQHAVEEIRDTAFCSFNYSLSGKESLLICLTLVHGSRDVSKWDNAVVVSSPVIVRYGWLLYLAPRNVIP